MKVYSNPGLSRASCVFSPMILFMWLFEFGDLIHTYGECFV